MLKWQFCDYGTQMKYEIALFYRKCVCKYSLKQKELSHIEPKHSVWLILDNPTPRRGWSLGGGREGAVQRLRLWTPDWHICVYNPLLETLCSQPVLGLLHPLDTVSLNPSPLPRRVLCNWTFCGDGIVLYLRFRSVPRQPLATCGSWAPEIWTV